MLTLLAYILYLVLALTVVIVVGAILYRNGRFYLVEIFGEEHTADVINRFLYTGYCLVNAGGAFRCLRHAGNFESFTDVIAYVGVNQGGLLLLLGIMHAFNLAVLPALKPVFRNKLSKTPNTNH